MKKHLHGKRHTIARRNVAIGREKKKIRKLNRQVAAMKNYNWADFNACIENTFVVCIQAVKRFAEEFEMCVMQIKKIQENIAVSGGTPLKYWHY